ncbi:MAG: LPXTG cell wall anchor domain-containing protein [Bacteroidia bacterium]|nr:LPXTG cell wall anchor domain-containing protein [Bacteroidia bacterium]
MVSTVSVRASAHSDSINIGWDSMDKIHQDLSKKSADLKTQIDEAGKKIEAAKAAQEKKPNYWMPIIGGAILGIGLAVWLRRKK